MRKIPRPYSRQAHPISGTNALSRSGPGAIATTLASLLFFIGLWLPPASCPWEKKTEEAIVSRAFDSLPAGIDRFLEERSTSFREGLAANPETVRRYAGFTSFDTTGYAADKLADQISFLQNLFTSERSDFLAYRLGVLTQLLLRLNSPFATATAPEEIAQRFMKDVEAHRMELIIKPQRQRLIKNLPSYLRKAIERSEGWGSIVSAQYRVGRGYNFIVRMAASQTYNESIYSVRDVLATIGSGRPEKVDRAELYTFYLDAARYNLSRGRHQEARIAYRKVGEIAASFGVVEIDSLQEALDWYILILPVFTLEERMMAAGIKIDHPVAEQMRESFLSALESLITRYLDSGEEAKARMALAACLREDYRRGWILRNLRKIYGLDQLKNLDVPENAWKIYLEANGFEGLGDRNLNQGRLWTANNAFVRAAALYSAIPESVRELRKKSRARIEKIIGKMRTIPEAALFSEELFQTAVDHLAEEKVDFAIGDLQRSQQLGADKPVVEGAITNAESLQLFTKGRDLYRSDNYQKGVEYFRKLIRRFPHSPFAEPARKMIKLHQQRRELVAQNFLLLLKGAYEASFIGARDTVYDFCDQILKARPEKDFRDRAELLIVATWYDANQRGYRRIYRIFRSLLDHQVLEEDNGLFVLKKRIDFYFGLKDPFPKIELAELDRSLLARLDLREEARGRPDARADAEDALDKATDEIEAAAERIASGEQENRDMSEAQALLEEAIFLLDQARDLFDKKEYEESRQEAEEAYKKAVEAREQAGEILGLAEDFRYDARDEIDRAESAVDEAEAALTEAEEEQDQEFEELRSDLNEARDLLEEAKNLFSDGNYETARERASQAIEKAEEVEKDAKEIGEKESEPSEEMEGGGGS